jgi:hypothetical protein
MYIPTDVELEELTQAVELVDKLYDKIGKAESYDLIEDYGIHYQLGKVSEMLRFGALRILLQRKGLI